MQAGLPPVGAPPLTGAHGQPETSEPGRDPVLLGGLPGVLLEQYFFDFGMLRPERRVLPALPAHSSSERRKRKRARRPTACDRP